MTKKFALLAPSFLPSMGGTERLMGMYCDSISDDKIYVISRKTADSKSFDKKQKYKVYRQPLNFEVLFDKNRFLLGLFDMLPNFFFSIFKLHWLKIDLIMCKSLKEAPVGYLISKITGKPYIIFAYAKEITMFNKRETVLKKMMIHLLSHSQKIICVCDYIRKEIIDIGIDEEKLVVNTVGVNVEKYYPMKTSLYLKKRYNVGNEKIILTMSRLEERKGFDKILEGMPFLLSKIPNLKYVIAGKGPFEYRLKELATQLKIRDSVIFTGFIDESDKVDLYNACDIFAMPSRNIDGDVEGFPIVYMEANSCGKPIIGGKSGGIDEAIRDGYNGFLVDPWSVDDITEKILLLLQDDILRQTIGKNGRQKCIEENNISIKSAKFLKILNEIKINA